MSYQPPSNNPSPQEQPPQADWLTRRGSFAPQQAAAPNAAAQAKPRRPKSGSGGMGGLVLAVLAVGAGYYVWTHRTPPDLFNQHIPATVTSNYAQLCREAAVENCQPVGKIPLPSGTSVTITDIKTLSANGSRWAKIWAQTPNSTQFIKGFVPYDDITPNSELPNPPAPQTVTFAQLGLDTPLDLTKGATIISDTVIVRAASGNDSGEIARMHKGEAFMLIGGPYDMPTFNTSIRKPGDKPGFHKGDGQITYTSWYLGDTGKKMANGQPLTGFVPGSTLKQLAP